MKLNTVTAILRRNEKSIYKTVRGVKLIECNQLASNHPVEDRLRVSKLHLNNTNAYRSKCFKDESETLMLSVFDGHGGGAVADIICRRLFHYVALSLSSNPSAIVNKRIENTVEDLFLCPQINNDSAFVYDPRSLEKIKIVLGAAETEWLSKYAEDLHKNPVNDVQDALRRAFIRCDEDLSQEVERSLTKKITSNILLHYYLSVAVSGCCVTLMLIHKDKCYIASSGDCRAVMGYVTIDKETQKPCIKHVALSNDHNSDNLNEIKRLYASHPANEHNNIIRNNRLLGQLMPFRAFGDFCYKWSAEKMKNVGLTRAFGPHVIPPYYHTPPYLIVEPEIKELPLNDDDQNEKSDKFILLATDGLWEQFESDRSVVKSVIKHKHKFAKNQEYAENQKQYAFKEGTTMEEILDVLRVKARPQKADFNDSLNIDVEEDFDLNCCTHLIRTALSANPAPNEPHIDEQELRRQRHQRLVTFLTLPESVVRSFRDDISLILTHFN
ncbi:Pyruvate dehydrogenase [acetyl-transferring]-phosphatase 1-like protein [Dinothrombium tinctorium]|uniref:Pyruvate dehydrogenase [acetyl-transferring]-phosphatase 1-like protein n=1 Tax=Dinothrombium tinctorium TaxID=1965070 RepID=A0A3S4QGQ0_9ACAR|nr:Pyruvate dehydrogenase [acetyl-transferring]-phosphatase 1-like protein [Dinothrombium tinctorium]